MDELTSILEAAAAAINPCYFHLQLDGGSPVYRERVYCYELYHQLRSRWPSDSPYFLNGEVDKAVHPILRLLGADFAKPDLLVHRAGYMSHNHAIIEVKPSNCQRRDIIKDLNTLSLFRERVGYQRAIFLLYGWDANAAKADQVMTLAAGIQNSCEVEIWLHQEPGRPAAHYGNVRCGPANS